MTEMEKYREHIDRIDQKLIDLLAGRFVFSSRIGKLKQEQGIPVLQSSRWDKILSSGKEYAINAGLTEEFTEEFLNLIHRESIRIQSEIGGRSEPENQ